MDPLLIIVVIAIVIVSFWSYCLGYRAATEELSKEAHGVVEKMLDNFAAEREAWQTQRDAWHKENKVKNRPTMVDIEA